MLLMSQRVTYLRYLAKITTTIHLMVHTNHIVVTFSGKFLNMMTLIVFTSFILLFLLDVVTHGNVAPQTLRCVCVHSQRLC